MNICSMSWHCIWYHSKILYIVWVNLKKNKLPKEILYVWTIQNALFIYHEFDTICGIFLTLKSRPLTTGKLNFTMHVSFTRINNRKRARQFQLAPMIFTMIVWHTDTNIEKVTTMWNILRTILTVRSFKSNKTVTFVVIHKVVTCSIVLTWLW